MDLTICICTHDRPSYMRDCLEGLRHQTVAADRFSVLIVDSGSPEPARTELRRLAHNHPGARLIRVDEPGLSAARNAGASAAATGYVAYIDDDAIPAEDWVATILEALAEPDNRPEVLGGRILPKWEAPLPPWWPASLRGLLSIIEHEGAGEFRTDELPPGLEPYGCNMIVHVPSLLDTGGFGRGIGRMGKVLLSDEDVQLAWRLQDQGLSARYDSRIVVRHQIQAKRLNPGWLLSRLWWQGASTVLTRRLLNDGGSVWAELPRRLVVATLFAPAVFWPMASTGLLAIRWRRAYAAGFVRAALGWRANGASGRMAQAGPAAATQFAPVSIHEPICDPTREAVS
jgi:glucosyl-dolichyl phosphate glucuronosyltransferase